ncbi:dUTP diphosphatase [Okeania sp. SIO1I7]|uniref:dUTP diphosphatase n=1 Tax=Okeania sp. SIO1I7 TaxID=2607772 RepID=UPI0013FCEB9E|nr:dUTP diphosphatase [Okeania sp. SIO1I7]NET27429.1 dUTP diphosphatase [Okeania sp. SIO1I7]
MRLKVKKLDELAIVPYYAHPQDVGLDLFSIDELTINPGENQLICTGISMELPSGTEAQIRPISGLALKHKITVLNTPGTIDETYRGEVGIILINHGKNSFQVTRGMKIAQMVIASVLSVKAEEVDELSTTERDIKGFSSTGL